jgi:1-aminocyclopropane-1-carboxylate deaminase/D-cysteine desulfhydrase-like pyridoxal-dependent ACC family enzyme
VRIPASLALERLLQIPRVELGTWPTPLDRINHPVLGPMLVKRDDLSGFGAEGRSGVKARKLEGFLAYLHGRGVEELIMPLGNITNLGPDLLKAAAELHIATRLLIVDDPPMSPVRRAAVFAPLVSSVRLIGRSYASAGAHLLLEGAAARLRGRRAMIALPSPAHPAAVVGTARGYLELMEQLAAAGEPPPRAVYVAAAAGSSVAGFALGEALMRAAGAPAVRIVGVQVAPAPIAIWLSALVRWTARFFRLGPLPSLNTVSILRDPRHVDYGHFDALHEATCRRVHEQFGLTIDPIYGGKSWTALEASDRGAAPRDRPILFWHCGFTPGWEMHRTVRVPQAC